VAASAQRLWHSWGVHAIYVEVVKPGVIELRLVGFDLLDRVRMPRKAGGGFLRVPVALRPPSHAAKPIHNRPVLPSGGSRAAA
jgi:DNA segregation ATPase FtsK/SpoIIIE, S-DNA-T family